VDSGRERGGVGRRCRLASARVCGAHTPLFPYAFLIRPSVRASSTPLFFERLLLSPSH